MTRRDGGAALVALILVLAGALRAGAWGTLEQSDSPPKADGQSASPGGTAHLSGEIAPLGPATGDPIQVDGFGDIGFSSRRVLEGFYGGDERWVPLPSAGIDPRGDPASGFFSTELPDSPGDGTFLARGQSTFQPRLALRFGWWLIDTEGDLTKVGEYQDLESSSPFFEADALLSDGVRTIDLFATGLDNETNQAGLTFFGPWLQADVDYQRYLHRLDHDPLTNMGELQSGEEIVRQDLSVGEDFAVRVQDFKTSLKGKLGENLKLRLNVRAFRKQGQRQAKTVQHCFGGIPQGFGLAGQNTCHVLGQGQQIDWLTLKLEPVVEGKLGPIRAEYSRPMRIFNQNDQIVSRPFGLHFPTDEPYAFVPESYTQADRLKLSVNLPANTHAYARMQTGDTHNKFRQTHRSFYGLDLRLTNHSWEGLTLTGYGTLNNQTNQDLPSFLPEEEQALAVNTSVIPPYGIRHPIDYFSRAVGADASWNPFRYGSTFRGLALTAGAEQGLIERSFAEYVVQTPEEPPGPVVHQKRTDYTSFHAGASLRWSPSLETYVRYRLRVTRDPLFALNRYYGYTNTSLPEEDGLVEVGGTWTLADNFLATASVGLRNRQNRSDVADFTENDYPMTFTLWYAPTPEWSFSAGYGFYSNWIDQDITFPSDTPNVSVGDTSRWSYGGQARVLSVGGSYVWTRKLTLSGGVQFVWSRDLLDPLAPWPDLPAYSSVIVDRARVTGGLDWRLHEHVSAYFRYVYEDYEDESVAFNSGTAHMFLTGLSAIY